MSQTILVADDEKEIREILRLYIEKDGYSVIQAENGRQALELADSTRVDLAIVDVMMPELDGYQLIRALRERWNMPIIVVSAKTENNDKILGLDLGADDYVTKPFDALEVVARIRAQLRRYTNAPDRETGLITVGALCLDTSACTLRGGGEAIPLTATEFGIMKLLMQKPGHVFTKKQIYAVAWNGTVAASDNNTIMVAISKLRGKLPVESGVSIGTVRGLGYRLEVEA